MAKFLHYKDDPKEYAFKTYECNEIIYHDWLYLDDLDSVRKQGVKESFLVIYKPGLLRDDEYREKSRRTYNVHRDRSRRREK